MMHQTTSHTSTPTPKSHVLRSMAKYYDVLVALLTLGRERKFRDQLAALVNLAPGETVLDVGCGTGSLALAAKRRVGERGAVTGVDPSSEMIDRARRKSAKGGLDVRFEVAGGESLPFSDKSFDVVLSTLMMHHLPRALRERCALEMHRVLRLGGRVLVVDFEKPVKGGSILSRLHRRGHVPLRDIVELLDRAGLRIVESGSVGMLDLKYVVANRSRDPE